MSKTFDCPKCGANYDDAYNRGSATIAASFFDEQGFCSENCQSDYHTEVIDETMQAIQSLWKSKFPLTDNKTYLPDASLRDALERTLWQWCDMNNVLFDENAGRR